MFTDLNDIFAMDDLNFILHSIKIAEKKNPSLAATISSIQYSP